MFESAGKDAFKKDDTKNQKVLNKRKVTSGTGYIDPEEILFE